MQNKSTFEILINALPSKTMKMVLSKRKKFIKKEIRNKLESTLVDSIKIPDLQNGFTKKRTKDMKQE